MKHDKNGFVRYESAQSFGLESIQTMMRGGAIDESYVEAFGYVLESEMDLSFKAHLLEFPSVSAIMQQEEEIDFEKIYEAKERLQKYIATIYKDKLIELYKIYHHPLNKALDAQSISHRAIKNRALKILSALGDDEVALMANAQYRDSVTMTDRIVALDILENISPFYAVTSLEHFYNRYKEDTLVMQKYFSILAASHREGTLDRVMALQNDDSYNELVPNLVRSLVGVFSRNYKYFHAKDGYGYKFVADKIVHIDKINPQMASALAGAFKVYKKLNHKNKELMRVELERILAEVSLSKNVYEIVSKILKD
jgi:aminopeptidase N